MSVDQTAGVGMQVPGLLVGQLAGVCRAVLFLVGQINWGKQGGMFVCQTAGVGRAVCWLVKTAGVGRELCLSVKQLG